MQDHVNTLTDHDAIRSKARRLRRQALAEENAVKEEIERTSPREVERITELVADYEQKWPFISYTKGGSRAQKAMAYVLDGKVSNLYGDVWNVAGHQCSMSQGWCKCKDRAYQDIIDGKLCAHRLAVMLKENWHGKRNYALLDTLNLLSQYDYDYVDLLVERDYAYHGHGERIAVAGYLTPGQVKPIHWTADNRFEITLPQLQWVLEQVDWAMIKLPEKVADNSHYYYRFAQGIEGLPIIRQSVFFRDMTEQMQLRERMRRFTIVEIAATLQTIVNGPMAIQFSQYEANRIWEIKKQMDRHGLQFADIEALPESIKQTVYTYLLAKGGNDADSTLQID